MKKFRLSNLNKIFYNNRYLMVFSIVVAVIVWIAVVMEYSPETEYTISDVPVKVNVEDTSAELAGLHPFEADDYTVDLVIVGPRYSIRASDISKDDFNVSAVITDVTTVGEHVLDLKAVPVNKSANYSIESMSRNTVTVYFDNYTSEKVIPVELTGVPQDNLAVEGKYCDGAVLSQNTITVSGATSQINRLGEKVYATMGDENLSFPLEKTATFDAELLLKDSLGNDLRYINIDDGKKIVGTIPVLEMKTFKTNVSFKNTPVANAENALPSNISYTITPSEVSVAAAEDVLNSMSVFDIGSIDFKDIPYNGGTFTFKTSDITSAKVVDKSIEEFTVTVKVENTSSTTVDIPSSNVKINNTPDGYTARVVASSYCIEDAVICGVTDSIEDFDVTKVNVDVDLGSVENLAEGRREVNAVLSVNQNGFWVYGKYSVLIELSK